MPISRYRTKSALPSYSVHPLWHAVLMVLAALSAEHTHAGGIDTLYPNDPFSVYNLAHDTRPTYLSMPCEAGAPSRSLALSDIVDRALCNNPQTREAWMTTRLRAAELGVSKGAYLPAITVEASLNRVLSENSQINIGQTTPQRYNQHSVGVNINYVLLDFGTRSAQVDSAKEILTSANATLNETIQNVYLAAARAYYDLFSAQASLASTRQAEYYASEAVIAAKARHASGAAALNDVLQAQMQHSQVKLNRQEAEAKVKVQQGLVAMTIGLPFDTPFQLNAPDVAYTTENASDASTGLAVNPSPVVSQRKKSNRLARKDNTSEAISADQAERPEQATEAMPASSPAGLIDPRSLRVSQEVLPRSYAASMVQPSEKNRPTSEAAPALAFVQTLDQASPHKVFLGPYQRMQQTAFVPEAPATVAYASYKKGAAFASPKSRSAPRMDAYKIEPAAIPDDVTTLITKAESGRPVLQAAHAQVRSAEARLRAVNAQGWPTLVLNMGATDLKRDLTETATNALTGQSRTMTSKLGGTEKTIGVSVQFPIFDRFNRQYQRQAAESQLELARIEEERLLHQVKMEVWRSYQDTLLQLQSIQSTEDLLTSAQHNYKMAEGRYNAGVGSMLEWMSAQVGLRNAEQQHIHALHNWQIARLKLAQSIGRLGLDKI